MSRNLKITINAQEFAELYLEFLQNNVKIATKFNATDNVVAGHYQGFTQFEAMHDSIEQGIIHMQHYAIEQIEKSIKKQEYVLDEQRPTDGNQ